MTILFKIYSCFSVLSILLIVNLHSLSNEDALFNAKNTYFQSITNLTEDELTPILIFLKNEEKDCAWIREYPIITSLIKEMGLKIGCEIGVAYGFQSKYFLENTEIEHLYSIDPYQHFSDYDDIMNFSQKYFDVLYYKASLRLAEFKERSTLIRASSKNASQQFQQNSLDFVYIDGNHSYLAVTSDLNDYFDKVRSGGLISGDDYVVFPTTAQAVNNFVQTHQISLFTKENKWWFIKP